MLLSGLDGDKYKIFKKELSIRKTEFTNTFRLSFTPSVSLPVLWKKSGQNFLRIWSHLLKNYLKENILRYEGLLGAVPDRHLLVQNQQ